MKNQKTMGNKGFSLVELIVVIAIMVVLVAVLAPVFTKYVEQSRRATDVSNANAIAEAVLADAADGAITAGTSWVAVTAGHPTAIQSVPSVKGNVAGTPSGLTFYYRYNSDNTVNVQIAASGTAPTGNPTYDLATDGGAQNYKNHGTNASTNQNTGNTGNNG